MTSGVAGRAARGVATTELIRGVTVDDEEGEEAAVEEEMACCVCSKLLRFEESDAEKSPE